MLKPLIQSWSETQNTLHTKEELLSWINQRNQNLHVSIRPNRLSQSPFWFYDEQQGCITNKNNSFFQIYGLQTQNPDGTFTQQPIILQDEIGYLGILCKEINGTLYFLMQAKIEPGNINKIQISPTIQATKSNFTQKHGGKRPAYLDYFLHAKNRLVLVDQIQSEQSSRFYKKRNRNIVLLTQEEVEVLPSHRWMTLGQIKQLMRYDNLVNMDTRTVISCLPFSLLEEGYGRYREYFRDQSLYNSIFDQLDVEQLSEIYGHINDQKMFQTHIAHLIPLSQLSGWEMDDWGIRSKTPYSFDVIYCDVEVEGREVTRWTQPLFRAGGIASFGLYTRVRGGKRQFLVHAQRENGCFDQLELGPTVQREAVSPHPMTAVEESFFEQYRKGEGILYNVLLSEEGGRFYQEQNRNVILQCPQDLWEQPPEGYFWTDYRTLNTLVQVNNCLNIQLRNLLSLLEV